MTDTLNISMFIFISVLLLFTYVAYQTRNKYRNAIYNISISSSMDITEYHLVVEIKHGRFTDTRKLSYLAYILIPKNISSLLKNTYKDFDSAEVSLNELKKKYICR